MSPVALPIHRSVLPPVLRSHMIWSRESHWGDVLAGSSVNRVVSSVLRFKILISEVAECESRV